MSRPVFARDLTLGEQIRAERGTPMEGLAESLPQLKAPSWPRLIAAVVERPALTLADVTAASLPKRERYKRAEREHKQHQAASRLARALRGERTRTTRTRTVPTVTVSTVTTPTMLTSQAA